jgi:hypothetical protein
MEQTRVNPSSAQYSFTSQEITATNSDGMSDGLTAGATILKRIC